MITLICSLRLADGQIIAAQIVAESQLEDVPVVYSGPTGRLPLLPAKASGIELRSYFRSFARELGAQFREEEKDDRVVIVRDLAPVLDQLKELAPKRRPHRSRRRDH